MAGIQQAVKDPKMLAQLFQDMQVRLHYVLCFRNFKMHARLI
jgi:hypothetical protein